MRPLFARLHRWVGLGMAVFLFVSGITGAIIAFEHELDVALNPEIYVANSSSDPNAGRSMSAFEAADFIEASDPRIEATYLPLSWTKGHTALVYVDGRIDPETGEPYDLGYNQVFLDPVTGEVQGTRTWGEVGLAKKGWLPMIYLLHFTMLAGDFGLWFMGILAMCWVVDCGIALYLSFPSRKHWRRSFQFRLRQGKAKLNFDLHRSGGVWAWLLVGTIALTSVWMNLAHPLVEPIVEVFSAKRDTPFAVEVPEDAPDLVPTLTREEAATIALAAARERGIEMPLGAMQWNEKRGFYSIGFFHAEKDHAGHGDWTLTPPYLFVDGTTGEVVGQDIPGTGPAGAIYIDLQFPLHSGRIMGTLGKIVVACLGVIVAMLSVTGVVIWARKHRKRPTTAA